MDVNTLRTSKEKVLFPICLTLSIILWIALVVTIIGLVYGAFIALAIFVAHALLLAHIRGNGVRLSPNQFPEIHAKVVAAAKKFELPRIPEAFVIQEGGALNAFATKFIGRKFIIIYAGLLEACPPDGREVDMIIGHEMGHHALGHLKWLFFLAPARIMPWLGAAYSRACEYSCDRCGLEIAGDLNAASKGLAILAAGGKLAREMNLSAFVAQTQGLSGFWPSIYMLSASHPYLATRVAALMNWKTPGSVPMPGCHFFAYPLAPFLGFGRAGMAAAPLVMIAVIGIMAAIAIPQFQHFRAKARAAALHSQRMDNKGHMDASVDSQSMDMILREGHQRALQYVKQNGQWPCSVADLGPSESQQEVVRNGWAMAVNCQHHYIALFYNQNGVRHYRAIMLDTGQITTGLVQ